MMNVNMGMNAISALGIISMLVTFVKEILIIIILIKGIQVANIYLNKNGSK